MTSDNGKVNTPIGQRLAAVRDRLRPHLPYWGLACLLYLLLATYNAYGSNWFNPPISPGSDLNIHIPRAYRLDDPRLYSRDPVLNWYGWETFGRLDDLLFPLLLTRLLPLLGGVRPALIVLAFLLGLVFVTGIYSLASYLSGDYLAGVIAAFLASFNYKVIGGVQLGFFPDNVYPRNVVVAVSPFVFLLFLRWRADRRLWIVYGLLGIMANFHTLAALHLVLILTLVYTVTSKLSWSSVVRIIVAGVVCLLCALPAAIVFLPMLTRVVTVSSDKASFLTSRYDFAIRPSTEMVLILTLNFLPFALAGGLGLYRAFRRKVAERPTLRVYLVAWLIVLLLPWVGVAINSLTLSFRQLELLRFTRYYFALALAPTAMLMSRWMKRRSRVSLAATPVALILLVLLSRQQVAMLALSRGIEWFGLAPQASTVSVEEGSEVEYPKMVRDWKSFSELCDWADVSTPIDALFLAPVDWSEFRVYARRGMVVSYKGPGWEGWAERYEIVQDLYARPTPDTFLEVAATYEADYVIVMKELSLQGLEAVYENAYYAVYEME
jgi:hypothetical protein